jgi:hypothetical protein
LSRTADGGLILGLAVDEDSEWRLAELLDTTGSDTGCMLFEDPPPDWLA